MKRLLTINHVASCRLPTRWGEFAMHGFRGENGEEGFCLEIGTPARDAAPLVRVHSECLTGESLHSLRCDCGEQLDGALARMAEAGSGLLVYLRQEGRGIGLLNKIRAYALQDDGFDTVDANLRLGLPADGRNYDLAAAMLLARGVRAVRLMTNNPDKYQALSRAGIRIVERIAMRPPTRPECAGYLKTKAERMGHLLT
jgi:GTP cyclohydrolase II